MLSVYQFQAVFLSLSACLSFARFASQSLYLSPSVTSAHFVLPFQCFPSLSAFLSLSPLSVSAGVSGRLFLSVRSPSPSPLISSPALSAFHSLSAYPDHSEVSLSPLGPLSTFYLGQIQTLLCSFIVSTQAFPSVSIFVLVALCLCVSVC